MRLRPFDYQRDSGALLSFKIRKADAAELRAGNDGKPPVQVLREAALDESSDTYVLVRGNGQMLGIGGLTLISGHAIPWMIVSTEFHKHKLKALKLVLPLLHQWRHDHPFMLNYVDIRNTASLRFLKWLGAEFPNEYTGFVKNGTTFKCFIFNTRGEADV